MNETYVRDKVNRAFRALGYDANVVTDTIVCPRCNCKIVPSRGKPDVTMVHPNARSCYVEVKVAKEASFPFNKITPEQRAKLDDWKARGGIGYLALGIIRKVKANDRLESIFLVEWSRWSALEKIVSKYQQSIPIVAGPGFSKELQKGHLDIERQLWPWTLEQVTGGWIIPPKHPAISQLGLGENANE
jgi:hypothetical protein